MCSSDTGVYPGIVGTLPAREYIECSASAHFCPSAQLRQMVPKMMVVTPANLSRLLLSLRKTMPTTESAAMTTADHTAYATEVSCVVKGGEIGGFGGGSLEHPRQWLGAQWDGLFLGVPSCPEP